MLQQTLPGMGEAKSTFDLCKEDVRLNRFVFFRCTRCGEILKKPLHQKGNQCIRCSLAPDPAYDD